MLRFVSTWFYIAFLAGSSAFAQEVKILSWNVESGQSQPSTIADQLADFQGYGLIGLSEVDPTAAFDYVTAAAEDEGSHFDHILSESGSNDRLLLIWNSDRFTKVAEIEMLNLKFGGGRGPLAVKLRDNSSGQTFWFMVNHLHRVDKHKRNKQATGLREWFKTQDIPVIAVGDYNFDYDVPNGPGNTAFNTMLNGGHVKWIEPLEKIKTQSAPQFNSVLDFVFVNDDAASWTASSKILKLAGEFVPENEKSDHRPVEATINIPPAQNLAAPAISAARASVAPRAGLGRGPVKVDSPKDVDEAPRELRPSGINAGAVNRDDLKSILDELRELRSRMDKLEQRRKR